MTGTGNTGAATGLGRNLLRRTFAIDVLACPGCGGRLQMLATIAHPPTITKILRHLGLPVEVPEPVSARQLAW